MRLQLSKLALEDIDQIYDYTLAAWSEAQAIRYVNQLWDALEELQTAPERWRRRDDLYPGAQVRVCGRHLIIFRMHDGVLQVSRILHSAMNLPKLIPTTFMEEE